MDGWMDALAALTREMNEGMTKRDDWNADGRQRRKGRTDGRATRNKRRTKMRSMQTAVLCRARRDTETRDRSCSPCFCSFVGIGRWRGGWRERVCVFSLSRGCALSLLTLLSSLFFFTLSLAFSTPPFPGQDQPTGKEGQNGIGLTPRKRRSRSVCLCAWSLIL